MADRDQYELAVVNSVDDWDAYHDIRKAELFDARGSGVTYDPDHPDESLPDNFPLLLKWKDVGIGTTRLDLRPDGAAVIRLVAVSRAEQRKGHGWILNDKVEAFARTKGVSRLLVNAAPEAVEFYERLGFHREAWSPAELTGIASECIQMTKFIG
jgi:N-acetylglutamate synthase-like GNAT family acetyltransferase